MSLSNGAEAWKSHDRVAPVDRSGSVDLPAGPVSAHRFLEAAPSDATRLTVVALCLVVLLLALVIGLRLASRERRQLVGTVVSLLVTATSIAYLRLELTPRALPLGWLRVLHEGGSSILLEAAYGTPHAGLAWRSLVDAYTPAGLLAIRGAAHLNLCLTVLCTGTLFCVAHRVLKATLPALVFTAVYVVNVQTLSVATSELPSVVIELCFLLGVIGFEAVRCEAELGSIWAALGQGLFSVVALIAIGCRPETAIVALPALLFSWLQRSRPERLDALHALMARLVRRLLNAPRSVLVGLAVLTVLLRAADVGTYPSWIFQTLSPLDPGFALYPILLAQLVPLGIVVLFVLGWIHACRRAAYLALVPLTLMALFKLYEAAGHQVMFELVRYTSALTTAAIWVALLGWRELEEWAKRWNGPHLGATSGSWVYASSRRCYHSVSTVCSPCPYSAITNARASPWCE